MRAWLRNAGPIGLLALGLGLGGFANRFVGVALSASAVTWFVLSRDPLGSLRRRSLNRRGLEDFPNAAIWLAPFERHGVQDGVERIDAHVRVTNRERDTNLSLTFRIIYAPPNDENFHHPGYRRMSALTPDHSDTVLNVGPLSTQTIVLPLSFPLSFRSRINGRDPLEPGWLTAEVLDHVSGARITMPAPGSFENGHATMVIDRWRHPPTPEEVQDIRDAIDKLAES